MSVYINPLIAESCGEKRGRRTVKSFMESCLCVRVGQGWWRWSWDKLMETEGTVVVKWSAERSSDEGEVRGGAGWSSGWKRYVEVRVVCREEVRRGGERLW